MKDILIKLLSYFDCDQQKLLQKLLELTSTYIYENEIEKVMKAMQKTLIKFIDIEYDNENFVNLFIEHLL